MSLGHSCEYQDQLTGLSVAAMSSSLGPRCKGPGHNHPYMLAQPGHMVSVASYIGRVSHYVCLYYGVDDVEHVRHPTRHTSVQDNPCRFN